MRAATGSIGSHVQQEVTTTCRLLKITRPDGVVVRYTDHDRDLLIDAETEAATGLLQFELTENGPSEAYGIFSITAEENAVEDETVTIGSTVYTFKNALGGGGNPFEVLIGAELLDTLTNLRNAINAGSGAGTLYGTGTTAHPDVTADLIDVTNPLATPGSVDEVEIDSEGVGTFAFGNVGSIPNAFDGDIGNDSRLLAPSSHGMYVGLAFDTPRIVTKVRIRDSSLDLRQFGYDLVRSITSGNLSSLISEVRAAFNTAKGT